MRLGVAIGRDRVAVSRNDPLRPRVVLADGEGQRPTAGRMPDLTSPVPEGVR